MKIILLHGLFMHRLIMSPLAKRLAKLGWQVENLSYPSTKADKEALFQIIDAAIGDDQAIMVGHSLGGLVIKDYLKSRQLPITKVPMVITLGTPHQGAKIVKDMEKVRLQGILGSAVQFGLIPTQFSERWQLPQQLISIAGNVKIGPRPVLDKVWRDDIEESDGTVSIEETRLSGMTDHIVLRQTHTSLVYSKEVVTLIDKFANSVR